MNPRVLDATYRARAIPTGSARYFSWLFAAPIARAPLLGIYALQAEWTALTDPRTEHSAAQIKLAWWQEEMRRLNEATPVHPISSYLAELPGAARGVFAPLIGAIDAATVEISGVPLERTADLQAHAFQLRGHPLMLAAQLSAAPAYAAAGDESALRTSIGALAVADYMGRALEDYRREARAGRVVFPVDELLAANIDNAALAGDTADSRLNNYLSTVRQRAADHYALAARLLPRGAQRSQRHLLILAALGVARLNAPAPGPLKGLYLAWTAARRATR